MSNVPCRGLMSEHPNLWDRLNAAFQNPLIETVEADAVAQPFRRLLVHRKSMTLVLESAYRDEIQLRVLRQEFSGRILFREVFLVRRSDERPVEIGLIHILLDHCPDEVREPVLEGKRPLGKLLCELGVKYSNRPSAYFKVASRGMIGEALGLGDSRDLYGRCSRLVLPSDQILADVIEILAPFES